mmetsp:Transcript_33677/g.52024  ORF Transcript_33677/g.52024 Transcript_33677/m.52024 type:complete len:105 (-) Transcript_33677:2765-3079(-)
MGKRQQGEVKKTLRTVLAVNYQQMVKVHGETAKNRFPHVAYGQDPNSETFKKSFPLSYKRYFFKLVKNIIINKKTGQKYVPSKPPAIVMGVGSRVPTLDDPIEP